MARLFDQYWLKPAIVEQMKMRAKMYCGIPPQSQSEGINIVQACSGQYMQKELITLLAYTVDDGMHSSGWWKNPEYARCWHLSLSYWYPDGRTAPRQNKDTAEWVKLFFQPNEKWVWSMSAQYDIGKKRGVNHYRLFADEHWQPIKPEGEVYNTLKTEKGWLSWSDLQFKLNKEEK